jgi:transposase
MSKPRRNFDADYKLHIYEQIRKQGITIAQICRDNNLGQTAVHRWLKQYDAEMTGQSGIGLPMTPEQRRIRELEEQVKQLTIDNNILSKAIVFFAAKTR